MASARGDGEYPVKKRARLDGPRVKYTHLKSSSAEVNNLPTEMLLEIFQNLSLHLESMYPPQYFHQGF